MNGRDVARGLVMAAREARRRGNQLRAHGCMTPTPPPVGESPLTTVRRDLGLPPDLIGDRFAIAALFDDLADWCDMEGAIRYDDGAEPDPAPPRLLLFTKPAEDDDR